ncbi:hypothetical protein R2F25_38805 [Streptomyces sp. UP1A-1]|nr:hypothetical protein [Streptomyces sp. UP1A-1]
MIARPGMPSRTERPSGDRVGGEDVGGRTGDGGDILGGGGAQRHRAALAVLVDDAGVPARLGHLADVLTAVHHRVVDLVEGFPGRDEHGRATVDDADVLPGRGRLGRLRGQHVGTRSHVRGCAVHGDDAVCALDGGFPARVVDEVLRPGAVDRGGGEHLPVGAEYIHAVGVGVGVDAQHGHVPAVVADDGAVGFLVGVQAVEAAVLHERADAVGGDAFLAQLPVHVEGVRGVDDVLGHRRSLAGVLGGVVAHPFDVRGDRAQGAHLAVTGRAPSGGVLQLGRARPCWGGSRAG